MRVQVAYVGGGIEALVALDVPAGSTVRDAVHRSDVLAQIEVGGPALGYAIYGRRVDESAPLADGDRVEITRPLLCDAKTARRRRAESK